MARLRCGLGPANRARLGACQLVPSEVLFNGIGKIRRDNYVFVTWIGDHGPRHVHVYRDGKLVVKWDLEHRQAMKGVATAALVRLIEQLEAEGLL